MALLLDMVRWLVGRLAWFSLIVLGLFALHLLIFRALPHLRQTAETLEQEPILRERLKEQHELLVQHQQRLQDAESKLATALEAQRARLDNELGHWRTQLGRIAEESQELQEQLLGAKRLQQEYCDSYNPLKLWFCSEMKRRFEQVDQRVRAARERLSADAERAREKLAELETALNGFAEDREGSLRALGRNGQPEAQAVVGDLDAARSKLTRAERELERTRAELEQVERLAATGSGWIAREWRQVGSRLAGVALVVLLVPYCHRFLAYFVLMPLLGFVRPIRISSTSGTLRVGAPQPTLALRLTPGDTLRTRSEYARPVAGRARSQLFYRNRAPFISYAAGLFMLTEIDAPARKTGDAAVTLASPSDPDTYLVRLDLVNHPGVVLHPRNVVAVLGDIELRTAWVLFNLHAWSTWQLRYIMFAGSGSVIVEGRGALVPAPLMDEAARIEQKFVVGFESQLALSTRRTETFWPYFWGKTPLVDDQFAGTGRYFWEKTPERAARSLTERGFDALFGAVGRLLGF